MFIIEEFILNQKYNLVADANMPHIDQLFGEFANITKLSGRDIGASDVKNADALLVRSITNVNRSLLEASKVKFVGTATIGIDHLDTDWLDKNGISWSSAAGCNAAAVAQYVISGICYWLKSKPLKSLQTLTVGIVGAGNVGSELARCLDILNIQYKLCDPPLKKSGDNRTLHPIDDLLSCDVITFHVPITRSGADKTFHLIDHHLLQQLTSEQLLINAARGEIADNAALTQYLKNDASASVILDVFENEPQINFQLANQCLLSTPHIAGHTLEGKLRGSYLVYLAFCRCFNLPVKTQQSTLFPDNNIFDASCRIRSPNQNPNQSQNLRDALLALYDIEKDSRRLLTAEPTNLAEHFDEMRKNYVASFGDTPRRDYSGWRVENSTDRSLELLTSR